MFSGSVGSVRTARPDVPLRAIAAAFSERCGADWYSFGSAKSTPRPAGCAETQRRFDFRRPSSSKIWLGARNSGVHHLDFFVVMT